MIAPTLISYTETVWNTTAGGGTKSLASISWLAGDVIIVMAGCESNGILGNPTATGGLTFTSQKSFAAGSTTACSSQCAAAVAAADGSGVISMTNSSTSFFWGMAAWVWRMSGGFGASVEQHTSTKTINLTTGADSAVCWVAFDFGSSSSIGSAAPAATHIRQAVLIATNYTIYVYDLIDQTSTSAIGYGISGSSGTGPWSIIAIEILGHPQPGAIIPTPGPSFRI